MAETLFNRAAGGRAIGRSGGTNPAESIHPEVAEVLRELGVDTDGLRPKSLGSDVTDGVDLVVTMGCGDECPVIPGARVVDWNLPDPADKPVDEVREIRDDIARRVESLASELLPA
jgi:protein-tyrosine-phosphatase